MGTQTFYAYSTGNGFLTVMIGKGNSYEVITHKNGVVEIIISSGVSGEKALNTSDSGFIRLSEEEHGVRPGYEYKNERPEPHRIMLSPRRPCSVLEKNEEEFVFGH